MTFWIEYDLSWWPRLTLFASKQLKQPEREEDADADQ